MDKIKLKNVVEAILVASDRVLNLVQLEKLLTEKSSADKEDIADSKEPQKVPESMAANDTVNADEAAAAPESEEQQEELAEEQEQQAPESINLKRSIIEVIESLQQDYAGRAMELKEVASGYRFQVRQDYADYVSKLWEERPSKYSRALLETLVLIAYRQPITRGEIEAIRGVSVSSHIIKTLVEREWVRIIGHRDVPGKPAIYGSTREFLDYFNLKSLDELPSLAELHDLDKIAPELALDETVDQRKPSIEESEQQTAESTTEPSESDQNTDDNEDSAESSDLVVSENTANESSEDSFDDMHAPVDEEQEIENRLNDINRADDIDNESAKSEQTDDLNATISQEKESNEV